VYPRALRGSLFFLTLMDANWGTLMDANRFYTNGLGVFVSPSVASGLFIHARSVHSRSLASIRVLAHWRPFVLTYPGKLFPREKIQLPSSADSAP
jgi:hypothetical protein